MKKLLLTFILFASVTAILSSCHHKKVIDEPLNTGSDSILLVDSVLKPDTIIAPPTSHP